VTDFEMSWEGGKLTNNTELKGVIGRGKGEVMQRNKTEERKKCSNGIGWQGRNEGDWLKREKRIVEPRKWHCREKSLMT